MSHTTVYLYAIGRTQNGVVTLERFVIAHPDKCPDIDMTGETHILRLSVASGPSIAEAVDSMRANIQSLAPHSRFWQFVDANATFPSRAPAPAINGARAKPKPIARTRIIVTRQRRAG